MTDDLQKRLDQGIYGTPQLNPDEQRRYLGTFRERCYLQMTCAQMKEPVWQQQLQKYITDYTQATCLLNGALSETIQTPYIQLLAKSSIPFTIITRDQMVTDEEIGLLLVAKEAVNCSVIDIAQKYPLTEPANESKTNTSFFRRFFH